MLQQEKVVMCLKRQKLSFISLALWKCPNNLAKDSFTCNSPVNQRKRILAKTWRKTTGKRAQTYLLKHGKVCSCLVTQPNKKQVILFPQAKLNFFHRFSAANTIPYLVFSQVRFLSNSQWFFQKNRKCPIS
jgi:hypothetical protein